MKIKYTYSVNWTEEQVKLMKSLGIFVKPGLDRLDIEGGTLHDAVYPYMDKWGYIEGRAIGTSYTLQEIDNSSLLVFLPDWTNGYPQPDNTHEWLNSTYDLSAYCDKCGCGVVQKQSFRLKKNPVWKNRKIFTLEWVYDELFLKKEIYDSLFRLLGFGYKPVLLHNSGEIIEDVVQLQIPITEIELDTSGLRFEICNKCEKIKYINQIEGFFPRFMNTLPQSQYLFRSREFYGSGAFAARWIFVTQELRQMLLSKDVKGIYIPCCT